MIGVSASGVTTISGLELMGDYRYISVTCKFMHTLLETAFQYARPDVVARQPSTTSRRAGFSRAAATRSLSFNCLLTGRKA